MAEPAKTQGAALAAGAGEPSMEEILASIRRILSEDEGAAAAGGAQGGDAPAAGKADDGVLQLTEEMLADPVAAPAAPPVAAAPVAAAPAPSPAPPAAPPPAPPLAAAPPPVAPPLPALPPSEGLLDAGAAAAAAAAFGQLARGSLPAAASPPAAWPLGSAALSVEDIVRQELRPLLSAWLNANLPRIVEEAVAREMERVRSRLG